MKGCVSGKVNVPMGVCPIHNPREKATADIDMI
jgi:hypothetical protein